MRAFFLHLALLAFPSSVFCQNSVVLKTSTTSEKVRWNLDNYVWSHTHYQTGKNDKPVVDFDLIDNWVVFEKDISITGDGKYFAYTTRYTWNKQFAPDSLVIMSTAGSWRLSFAETKAGFFSGDGRQYIFKNNGALYFVRTGTDQVRRIEGVIDYKKPGGKKSNWVAYQLADRKVVLKNLLTEKQYYFDTMSNYDFVNKDTWFTCSNAQKDLTAFNLADGQQNSFSSIIDYKLADEGKSLLLKRSAENGATELQYVTFSNGLTKTIWSSSDTTTILQGYNLDHSGNQVVFTIKQNKGNVSTTSLWYWRREMLKPVEKVSGNTKGINDDLVSGDVPGFSENGHHIKFTIEERQEVLLIQPDAVQLNVWSYFDTVLQSTQLVEVAAKKKVKYKAFFAVDGEQLIRENKYEKVKAESDNFLIMTKKGKDAKGDRFWERGYNVDSNWLVLIRDGSRKALPVMKKNNFWFSPDNKYLVIFDENLEAYFSYDLVTGKTANISGGIPANEFVDKSTGDSVMKKSPGRLFGVACWRKKYEELWIYGRYDIWKLDLSGIKTAVNITNGYGRKHQTVLRLSGSTSGDRIVEPVFIDNDILLKALNEDTKYNGFFRIVPGTKKDIELLYMGPCLFEDVKTANLGMMPLKAAEVNAWIVKKQNATEAPNYFLTKDFKTYKALTHLQPQKKYNWLTSELHHFKQLDGSIGKGILYKPENFDPSKRYPVIVVFYTSLSDQLYIFPEPEYMRSPAGPIDNPAWFVSHGYLVFLPDIDFGNRKWGPSTVNSVEGAARYLAQLPYVDGKNIGAAGHSNSGRFGYYLLTHSHVFKAMCIGAGATDMVSQSLWIENDGNSMLEWAERTSVGKGLGNLWEDKEQWLDHTAVLNADKITTPLLLFHNKEDEVRLGNAIELYTAMRRLGKKVWWLEYDDEGHTVAKPKDRKDFTIRYTQYFDHYLKGAPAPIWMSKGIPAKMKGVEVGYTLDDDQ